MLLVVEVVNAKRASMGCIVTKIMLLREITHITEYSKSIHHEHQTDPLGLNARVLQ